MKRVKAWAIVTSILCVLLLALSVICALRAEWFGTFAVELYEELTNEVGKTVEGMYRKLSVIVYVSFAIIFVINQILLYSYSKDTCVKAEEVADVVVEKIKREKKRKLAYTAPKETEHETQSKPVETSAENADNAALASYLDQFRK